ncbi:arrestin domain-containing protein 3 [Drosophila grimshawi]|uniref:GH18619 n=1 Tax=Drosophila grimshawi TaxID=7222 RepID=B4JHJ2_DROGR|nr:arrestin domain-containing protein 3 [Drosophila grimshawi]EDV92819.1 GH18619 [Drosophila grimshawi]
MPTTCVFQLDRLNPIYNSGEYISGRILLRTDKVKRVNAVYVTLEGEAKVQWSMSGKSETSNYSGHQQYLHTRTNVFDNSLFRAGVHVYVLTLRIPPDCPSTCKGPYGYIAYNISLTIDKLWGFDEVFRKPIMVVQTLDLNYNAEFALPVKDENIKYLCHWPCISGPISTSLALPVSGFAPLQDVPFSVEIDNQSPHYDIVGVEVSIKQHFVFLSRKPVKRNFYTKTLCKEVVTDRTLRLSKRVYESTIMVPMDTPRSTLNPNYIVFVHYSLQVKLKTGFFHYDTDLSVPIVVGTTPLHHLRGTVRTNQPGRRTPTPTPERQRLIERVQPRPATVDEETEQEPETAVEQAHQVLEDDEPPSYDSCLPPSFSFATLAGSQQTLESQQFPQPRIVLPKFPGFSTLIGTAPAHGMEDSGLDMHHYRSYGSLDTDHTGRSLDTFGSLCGPLSEQGELVEVEEDEEVEELAVLDVTVQVHPTAPLQAQEEHQF